MCSLSTITRWYGGAWPRLLDSEDDIEVIGEAGTAESAIARIPALEPDVAVLDVRLPDGNGVECAARSAPGCRSWPA